MEASGDVLLDDLVPRCVVVCPTSLRLTLSMSSRQLCFIYPVFCVHSSESSQSRFYGYYVTTTPWTLQTMMFYSTQSVEL